MRLAGSPTDDVAKTSWSCAHHSHPITVFRDNGSDIHEVSGSGNFPAASTVSHPLANAIERSLPLRANHRMTPLASQVVASSIVVFTSWATYLQDLFPPPFCPQHGSNRTAHALGFSSKPHSLGGSVEPDTVAKLAEDVKHHVDVALGETSALLKHSRFLRQNVEIEAEAIPSDDGVTVLDLRYQVSDQFPGIRRAHSVCRIIAIFPAVPKSQFVGIGKESGCTRDSQRSAGSSNQFRPLAFWRSQCRRRGICVLCSYTHYRRKRARKPGHNHYFHANCAHDAPERPRLMTTGSRSPITLWICFRVSANFAARISPSHSPQ